MAQLKDLLVLGPSRFLGNIYGTLKGNADTATRLETARKLKTKLDSITDVEFDGGADQTSIPITGTLGTANGGTGNTAFTTNRLVWTETATKLTAGYHYANSTKVAINSTTAPSQTFYVNGTAQFNVGTADNVANKPVTILGNGNRHLSLGGAGIQAYDSSNVGSKLYVNYNGGDVDFGQSTVLSNATVWGNAYVKKNTPVLYVQDTNTTAAGYAGLFLGNNSNASAAMIYLNNPNRDDYGGKNTLTIRNAVGGVRINNTVDIDGGPLLCHSNGTNYNQGIRIYPNADWSDIMLIGDDYDTTSNHTGTTPNSWGIFNKKGAFYITRNGCNTSTSAMLSCENNVWSFKGTGAVNVNSLKITSTEAAKHIEFSRNSYNYLASPGTGSYISFLVGTNACLAADSKLTIDTTGAIYPGTTNTGSLGTSSMKWANAYATTFHGDLNGNADTAKTLMHGHTGGGSYVSGDTHIMQLGYLSCPDGYQNLTLLITSAFWGNQHGSSDIIQIRQNTSTNTNRTVQATITRTSLMEAPTKRKFYAYLDQANKRIYLYVYVAGGNSYGAWNTTILQTEVGTWTDEFVMNTTYPTGTYEISYGTPYADGTGASGTWGISISGNAATATNADTLDGVHLNGIATAKSTTLAWGTQSTIATIGGNNINVTLPANPNTNTWRGIQNNLTSDSTTDSLSAAQGKALNQSKLGAKTANGYTGMTDAGGADNVWIRTTSQGIIPYQSGSAGSGHGSIGTSTWYFSNAYIDSVHGSLDGNAATATAIKTVSLTGGDGNTTGYRLICTFSITAWTNTRACFLIHSRHTGNGLVSVALGNNSATVSRTNVYGQIYYFGNIGSGSIIASDSFQLYASSDGTKAYLFWKYNDYTNATLTPLYGVQPSNGTWMTSIDASTYGTLLASTEINVATKLNTARTISLTGSVTGSGSFDGSGNLSIATTTNHTHSYLPLSGGTLTGVVYGTSFWAQQASGENQCGVTYNNKNGALYFWGNNSNSTAGIYDSSAGYILQRDTSDGKYIINAKKVYGAVWNDYAEYRNQKEKIEPGYVVLEQDDGKLIKSTARLQKGGAIVSDTFGFAIGETDENKTPLAVSGRVLAYTYEPREMFHAGDAVCTGPDGKVSLMTEEEEEHYPLRCIGIVSEIPDYETWGSGNVKVNNRIWIKVK